MMTFYVISSAMDGTKGSETGWEEISRESVAVITIEQGEEEKWAGGGSWGWKYVGMFQILTVGFSTLFVRSLTPVVSDHPVGGVEVANFV